MLSDAEMIAQELHRALRIVVAGRSHFGSDQRAPVRDWIDLACEQRRVAIEVVETLLANGTIAVGSGRQDVRQATRQRRLEEAS